MMGSGLGVGASVGTGVGPTVDRVEVGAPPTLEVRTRAAVKDVRKVLCCTAIGVNSVARVLLKGLSRDKMARRTIGVRPFMQ